MKNSIYIILLSALLLNCSKQGKTQNQLLTSRIKIEQINETIYQHVSYLETKDYGNVPCNGMIYIHNNEAIIYDTPVNEEASKLMINWIQKKKTAKIKAVIITHFHEDCLGGLKAFNDLNIASYASTKTISLIDSTAKFLPNHQFKDQLELQIGSKKTITRFFGEGHTKDNVVGYIPSEKTLFGGCLIKTLNAKKGNLADANVSAWSTTVTHIKNTYPEIKHIIPGHGKAGNIELLDYTIKLFSEDDHKK